MQQDDCFLCKKQRKLKEFVGCAIAEKNGLLLTHFPFVVDEKATRGHLIIEPKRHITDFSELNDVEAEALGFLIRKGSQIIKSLLKAEHVYLFRINDKVAHLHFHLVPRYAGTPKEFWGTKIMEWPQRPTVELKEISELSKRMSLEA